MNVNLFTISKFRYPKHIEDTFSNYNFYYEHDITYLSFFQKNNLDNNSIDNFKQIKNSIIKKICFALYVLYFNGGFFIELNVIPTNNLQHFSILPNKFYCVKSILNDDNLFLGIFGSCKQNQTILLIINELIILDKLNDTPTSNQIYSLIKSHDSILYLNETQIEPNYVSTIDENNMILFNHYHNSKYSYLIPFQRTIVKKPSNIKIGITLLLFDSVNLFFTNGINQNSLFLCELLLNCGFDVYFIVEDEKLASITDESINNILYDNRFKISKYSEILYSEFNVIITLSFSYGEVFIYNYLKHMNTKHVGYFCGNTYIIESEKILYNQHKNRQTDTYDYTINDFNKYDEIWSIPQMSEINLDYWCILYKCKCIDVPFIWSNSAIKLYCKANNCKEDELYYKNRGLNKKIAIFEPNISIMKWALPSILICEEAYRRNKNINHLYITNIKSSSTNDFNLEQFNKFMKPLDIVKDNKCSIESRYNTLSFMKNYADIVVSHQWGNPLNYLYFDLAWMGWPIIHNAYLCKDIGYYYNNFQLKDASILLEKAVENHDFNIDMYLETNRKNISKYLPENKILQETYKNLIYNLFN